MLPVNSHMFKVDSALNLSEAARFQAAGCMGHSEGNRVPSEENNY